VQNKFRCWERGKPGGGNHPHPNPLPEGEGIKAGVWLLLLGEKVGMRAF